MLRLRAFGCLRLDRDTAPVDGPAARPRPLALLAVIAAAGSRGITRDRLIGIFWPESTEDHARHVLSQSLYVLRKDLGSDELLLNGGALRFNPRVITSDVGEFLDAIEAAALDKAIEVYTGPFVDGFYLSGSSGFEQWAEERRSDLAAQYLRAVEAAATAAESAGDTGRAAELWGRAAATDPLATRPVVRRARALAACGDPAAALKLLRDHARFLAHEGVAIPRELATLEGEIRPAPHTTGVSTASLTVAPPPQPLPEAAPAPPATVAWSARTSWAFALAIVAAAGALALAALRERPTATPVIAVGLMESHLPADSLGLGRSLPDLITTQLAQVPGLAVVSRGRLLEVLGGQEAPGPGALSRSARAAGAHEIVEGAVYAEPNGLRLDLRRVDLATGRAIDAIAVEGRDPSLLVERAAAALASSLGLEPPSARLADVTSVSLVARRFYEEGLRSFHAGDHSAAARLFGAALADDSTFAMAAYYLARCQDVLEPDSVASRWQRASALASRATDRERLLILSGAAFTLNDARLITFAESLANRYPDDLDGRFMMAELSLTEGDFERAVAAHLDVARRDSASRRVGTARCRACEGMSGAIWASLLGDSLARAERLARELVSWVPARATYHGLLWTVLLRREDYDGARAVVRRQNEIAPGSASPRNLELLIAQRRGDFHALDSLTRTMIVSSEGGNELAVALEWRTTYLRERGQLRAALDTALAARRVADSVAHRPSDDPFAFLPRALTLLHQGAYDPRAARAAARLFDSMATMPRYPEPRMARHRVWMWTHRATALALGGDTGALPALEERIAAMARFSSYGRDRIMARYVRGLILEARGDLDGAAASYRAAIWSPTENHVAGRLGRTLLQLGRPDAAVRVLQPWLRGPLDAANQYLPRREVHELLGDAFAALGRADSARYHRGWGRAARRQSVGGPGDAAVVPSFRRTDRPGHRSRQL